MVSCIPTFQRITFFSQKLLTLCIVLICSVTAVHAQTGDCNNNSIPDVCDIDPSTNPSLCATYCNASPSPCGQSSDCNGNGFPDECDSNISATEADTCGVAQGITPLANGLPFTGSTVGTNPEGSTTCGKSGGNGSPSVHYTYTPDLDGTLNISLCGSDFDTVLSVHAPGCPTSSTSDSTIACSDDSGIPGCQMQSEITMPVVAGQTYVIRIAGASSHDEGNFQLILNGPPSTLDRDDCDMDGVLNSCELDSDGDRVPDDCDNCPMTANLDQIDSDGDGKGDACDLCINDPAKMAPGQCGCGVVDTDTDNDGVADCNDQCSADPAKSEPGVCGCGVSELDSDADGTPDCIDACVLDPFKTAVGICGCGVADTDSDNDGVADCNDQCTADPAKTAPGICGCGVADTDSDNDGVADCNDLCSVDPAKTAPGICGCGVADTDSDNDGVADCNDLCSIDPAKTAPGICGCGVADTDSDNDGTPDCNDQCVSDPAKTAPGACGCGVADTDSDNDGIPDCNDQCLLDPAKTLPGICGCGVADTDSDSDGVADCNDQCVADPAKTAPGICGCGVADTDSDNDGVADCNDLCIADPAKTAPGLCGCGVADTDSDNDGTPDCSDECSVDPLKTAAGICGCGVADTDSDNDGVADCNDLCSLDPAKAAPGVCGCGVADTDSDSDGTADCNDLCSMDPGKTASGICGCGIADTDSDNDGTADCNDQCVSDPAKTVPGICGCGVADTDSDSDGSADCIDNCPSDAGKTEAGICGCGVADTDSDSDGTADCNDECVDDPFKSMLGVCGCGVQDLDENDDQVFDCICAGVCDPNNPLLDEDEDGVPNCAEIDDGTLPCDSGSFIPKLKPSACAGPNGFFEQINIATILNQLSTPLNVRVEYRDLAGILQGEVEFSLGGLLKKDIIANDLGLETDSYGTLCVYTDATVDGAWSGGLTLYKKEFASGDLGLATTDQFDFALHYPFTNPLSKTSSVLLNTNTLGTDGQGTVANWIRLTDAVAGDSKGLEGVLYYTDLNGDSLGSHVVNIPDGGRFDFAAHEKVGFRGVGLAQFVPSDDAAQYYIESSRYFYKGVLASGNNFYTAFTIPNRPPTGAETTGRVANLPNSVSIVEMVNASDSDAFATFKVFNLDGSQTTNEDLFIAAKGTRHKVIGGAEVAANSVASAEVSGPPESIAALSLLYQFDAASGELLYAYAPPFAESAGLVQFSDFNSFIGHENTFDVFNSTDIAVTATITVIDYLGAPVWSTMVSLAPRATATLALPVPKDTYGTILVDSGGVLGLVVRNDVSRQGEYILAFPGR